jgi:glycosyltransferase involved in cell wall biosynthesis
VTVTRGRAKLAVQSIRCYERQTYPNKNMVLLSQGSEEENAQIRYHLQLLGRDDILFVTAPSDLSLGAMRNTSVELATGEVICQWDDDDLYHPERLATQYNVLRCNSGRIASVYTEFLKYFEEDRQLYWCDWSGEPLLSHKYLSGTVMFYKKCFGWFEKFYPQTGPQSKVEEDLNVLEKLLASGEMGVVRNGFQYIYVYHGKNTYDMSHHRLALNTSWGKRLMDAPSLLKNRSLLEETFRLVGMEAEIAVRSDQSVAFTYRPE